MRAVSGIGVVAFVVHNYKIILILTSVRKLGGESPMGIGIESSCPWSVNLNECQHLF
jgi:hypothetical protein